MNIKVCGVTSVLQLSAFDKLMVDYAGLVFNRQSDYFIGERISPYDIRDEDLDIKKTGVFADEDIEVVLKIIDEYGLDLVQLNGHESPAYCRKIMEETEVIKAFSIDISKPDQFKEHIKIYDDDCDYFLFDTVSQIDMDAGFEKFSLEFLQKTSFEKPFFIGGRMLKPSDAPFIHRFRHPDFFGVDLGCFFEKEPGKKDMALISSFIKAVNQVIN